VTEIASQDAFLHHAASFPDGRLAAQERLTAPTIFHEPWWLDLVTRGKIEMVESCEHGKVVGRMYFLRENRYGISSSNMPAFTHFLGPMIDPGAGSRQTRYLKELSVTADLIEKLPRFWSVRQKMHRRVTDVVEFQAAGFATSVQFTYEIWPGDEKIIWSAMRDKTRNAIRNGQKSYDISEDLDPDAFIDFFRSNVHSLGMTENVDLEIAQHLIRRCLEKNCGKFFLAKDHQGVNKAAIFIVWDRASCYYLLSTRAVDSTYGATAAALWAAIKFAAASGRIFDFDGVASEGAVKFYVGFGSTVSPRYIVSRSTVAYKLLREARQRFSNAGNPFC
jgi:Acetyltransferase (GNAT) domain